MFRNEFKSTSEAMLWAITSYFNPCRYRMRRESYRAFRRSLRAPLFTMELGFGGCFDLSREDADIMIRVEDGDVMFQKERLLNCLIEHHLPGDCDYVACDVGSGVRAWTSLCTDSMHIPIRDLNMNDAFSLHFQEWFHRSRNRGAIRVGCLPGNLWQLWHGDYVNRRYRDRHQRYEELKFDPAEVLRIGRDGAWRWSNPASEMTTYLKEYFGSRREDDHGGLDAA